MLHCSMRVTVKEHPVHSPRHPCAGPGEDAYSMPLPPADVQRQLKHQRSIQIQAYARSDGLWEIDAQVVDIKSRPTGRPGGIRPAGEPIHDLHLRLIVDTEFNVLQAGAESRATPFPGQCDQHGDTYQSFVGLNLLSGFKRAVRERAGGLRGCTHLTELADVLPTAVVQAFAGEVLVTHGDGEEKPFQLDRCHALVSHGEAVRLHFPRWFRQPGINKVTQNPPPEPPEGAPRG
jgi:hypothetical protein